MEIHDLNTKALTDPAYVAFDDGTDTYKTEFNDVVADAAAAAVADADLTDNTVAFTSGDAASPTAWTAVDVLTSGLPLKTLFNRISTMVKNVRYIWNKIGTASMGTTATTITGAIAEHESDISTLNSKFDTIDSKALVAVRFSTTLSNIAADGSGNKTVNYVCPSGYTAIGCCCWADSAVNRFVIWTYLASQTALQVMYLNLRTSAASLGVKGLVFCQKS